MKTDVKSNSSDIALEGPVRQQTLKWKVSLIVEYKYRSWS